MMPRPAQALLGFRRALARRLRHRDDRGAILVIAMIIVTTVALVTGAVLTRGDGSLRATVALRDVARTSYSADAAAQVAINGLRTGHNVGNGEPTPWYYTNVLGTGCFGYDGAAGATVEKDTLPLTNLIPQAAGETQQPMSARVRCRPEEATGEQGTAVPINNTNKPGNAILTLGTSASEDGFRFKTNGSGAAFRVRGGIWSHSTIVRENNGDLESTESIHAVTGCTPVGAMVAPIVNCNASSAPADPGYPSDLDVAGTGIPALQTPPASCPNNGSITLEPGYYDDAARLNALTDTNSKCFLHLKPGTYYLDFHNNSADPLFDADIAGGGGSVWTIGSNKTLIGGTLTARTTVPGRCVSPIDDVNAQGVQLVFGGDSRMLVNATGQDTAVELCGSYRANRPPIVLYGQKSGTATQTVIAPASALTGTATSNVTGFTQVSAANLRAADGNQTTNANLAYWQRDGSGASGNQAGTLTVSGFAPATSLPKGTVLTGARLKVTHRSTGAQNAFTLTPSIGTAPISHTLPVRTTLGTEDVDLSARPGWGALQKVVHDQGFTGASVRFDASLGRNQVAQLDAVRLELTYYLPGLRGQTTAAVPGNTVATPGGAAAMQVLGNSTTYYVQGTSYLPLAMIDLSLNNIDESVFRFGVVARALKVFETGSFEYPGAVIELPDNSPGFGTESTLVRLEVYLCPGTAVCTGGTLALRARVRLHDPGGDPAKRRVEVLGWSHPR